jgi:N-acetylated-alpha-linked acidic dipeptidase
VGTAVMRLADADLLPFEFTDLADTIHRYTDELKKLASEKQDEIREQNKELEEGVFSATSDPKQTSLPPPREEVPPYLNFAPLENGSSALSHSAQRYQAAIDKVSKNGDWTLDRSTLQQINAQLIQSERRLTTEEGLPGRPWFKHMIYAPGQYTGYGVKTIPGVREAIEQKKWKEADEQIERVGKVLQGESALIDSLCEKMEQGK